jgi:hypothetical protein
VAAGLGASAAAPVYLNVVEARSCAVSHRTPSPAAQPASGPCATPAAQSNPPADLAMIGHREPSARGVSAGLTYVMANGPMELIWTTVTPRAAA